MKERPILFSGPMVRAILDGRKTQTRRIVKPQPTGCEPYRCERYCPAIVRPDGELDAGPEVFGCYSDDGEWGVRCPYGGPGDRLWVRERWAAVKGFDWYRPRDIPRNATITYAGHGDTACANGIGKWRPSIHMPRWASRITLDVEAVRVERLQDITDEDAAAEGVEYRTVFAELWESINGRGSWDLNPWVWVVEFNRT